MQFYPQYSALAYVAGFGPGIGAYSGPGGGPTHACNLADNLGPYNLAPGDDLDIAIDGAAPVTATFNAAAASVVSGNVEPFNVDTLTLQLRVGPVSEPVQQVVLVGVAATAVQVGAQINAAITGVQSGDTGGTDVFITTDLEGTSARLEIVGGTALAALGFIVGVTNGSGNVADINAVTADEVDTIVSAAVAPDATVEVQGGRPEICTVSTGPAASLDVSGTAAATIGFRAGEVFGLGGTLLVALRWGKSRGMLIVPPEEEPPPG